MGHATLHFPVFLFYYHSALYFCHLNENTVIPLVKVQRWSTFCSQRRSVEVTHEPGACQMWNVLALLALESFCPFRM